MLRDYYDANEVANRPTDSIYGPNDHLTKFKCPVCGEETTEEYCENCVDTVRQTVDWLEEVMDTDWEKVIDLLGYYYERSV